jgi:hypothetical protein
VIVEEIKRVVEIPELAKVGAEAWRSIGVRGTAENIGSSRVLPPLSTAPEPNRT